MLTVARGSLLIVLNLLDGETWRWDVIQNSTNNYPGCLWQTSGRLVQELNDCTVFCCQTIHIWNIHIAWNLSYNQVDSKVIYLKKCLKLLYREIHLFWWVMLKGVRGVWPFSHSGCIRVKIAYTTNLLIPTPVQWFSRSSTPIHINRVGRRFKVMSGVPTHSRLSDHLEIDTLQWRHM